MVDRTAVAASPLPPCLLTGLKGQGLEALAPLLAVAGVESPMDLRLVSTDDLAGWGLWLIHHSFTHSFNHFIHCINSFLVAARAENRPFYAQLVAARA